MSYIKKKKRNKKMLRDEIKDYMDCNGYINPFMANQKQGRQCDNAVMFTAEYYIMQAKRCEATFQDWTDISVLLEKSCQETGLMSRYPGATDQDGPDNMLGALALSSVYHLTFISRNILQYGRKHWGWFNNEKPGTIYKLDGVGINWSAWLWRQPQLFFAALCASGENKWRHIPFALYSAIVILLAGYKAPIQDTDPRRLSWMLIQITKEKSWLCKMASRVWYKRLYKDYGVEGMRSVAAIYYQSGHPFAKYWVN